jgi:hypothetical protein
VAAASLALPPSFLPLCWTVPVKSDELSGLQSSSDLSTATIVTAKVIQQVRFIPACLLLSSLVMHY